MGAAPIQALTVSRPKSPEANRSNEIGRVWGGQSCPSGNTSMRGGVFGKFGCDKRGGEGEQRNTAAFVSGSEG